MVPENPGSSPEPSPPPSLAREVDGAVSNGGPPTEVEEAAAAPVQSAVNEIIGTAVSKFSEKQDPPSPPSVRAENIDPLKREGEAPNEGPGANGASSAASVSSQRQQQEGNGASEEKKEEEEEESENGSVSSELTSGTSQGASVLSELSSSSGQPSSQNLNGFTVGPQPIKVTIGTREFDVSVTERTKQKKGGRKRRTRKQKKTGRKTQAKKVLKKKKNGGGKKKGKTAHKARKRTTKKNNGKK